MISRENESVCHERGRPFMAKGLVLLCVFAKAVETVDNYCGVAWRNVPETGDLSWSSFILCTALGKARLPQA